MSTNSAIQAFLEDKGLTTSPYAADSRYRGLATRQIALPDGRLIRILARRFIAPSSAFAQIAQHEVVAGDRLDNLAAHYLGDPLLFWRIADANGAMSPDALTATAGRRLRITLAEGVSGIDQDGFDDGGSR
ncbi:LysM domain-containing protein [Niveibacterium terrae]|uniref:LysM domain-containing protein n=1 Tax=Niveibacterium terrae TaxID=3373598 RepID=UPI003A9066D3